ncbi:hypothetical protein EDB83DRAFT_1576028 [Lactarius deliciosus]|nr:hypothetical protein EDB83DRAFT_1576028 [Lactarius deliciosus]
MSQVSSTPASFSNFQPIFNAALKAYEKKTKKDLLKHPLSVQLQACHSSADILSVLQDTVEEFDQSRRADETLSRWLNPTINVLHAFSATLGELAFSPANVIFAGVGVLLLPRTSMRVKIPSLTFSSVLRASLSASSLIPQYGQQTQ